MQEKDEFSVTYLRKCKKISTFANIFSNKETTLIYEQETTR